MLSLDAGRRREQAAQLQRAAEAHDRAGESAQAWLARCDRVGALIQFASNDAIREALDDLRQRARGTNELALCDIVASEAQIVFGEFEAVANAMPAAIDACAASGDIDSRLLATRRLAVAHVNHGSWRPSRALVAGCSATR